MSRLTGWHWLAVWITGCILLIASDAHAQSSTPHPTPEGEYTVYTVRAGDTLSSIAQRSGVSIRAIIAVNRIVNPDQLSIGQRLYIPSPAAARAALATAVPALSTPTTAPALPTPSEGGGVIIVQPTPPEAEPTTVEAAAASAQPMQFGYVLYTQPAAANADSALLIALNAQWAGVHAYWNAIQPTPDTFDYAPLDAIVNALTGRGLRVLLTVSRAPAWARSSQQEYGAPDDFETFAVFMSNLAARYAGRIAAYEIWHEPNLRREWNSAVHPLGAQSYAALLQTAARAIRQTDPAAQVISAGLAPTGIDDGFNAVNDRRFLYELLAAGVAGQIDGIGIHPFGFAAPPDFPCCDAPEGVLSHYGDPAFYFSSQLAAYRAIIAPHGSIPLWVTAFGWGVATDESSAPRNAAYLAYNTREEQAAYTIRAIEILRAGGDVRVALLHNVNGCSDFVANPEVCFLSVNQVQGAQPPVFDALRQIALGS